MVELRIFQVPKYCAPSGYLVEGLEGSLLESLASEDAMTFYTYSSGSRREEAVVGHLRDELARFEKSEKVDDLARKIKEAGKEANKFSRNLKFTKPWNWYLPWRKGPVDRVAKVIFYAVEAILPIAAYEIWREGDTLIDCCYAVFWGACALGLPVATEISRRMTRGRWRRKVSNNIKTVKKHKRELASEREKHANQYAAAEDLLANSQINVVYAPIVLDVVKEAKRYDSFMDVNWGKVRNTIKKAYLRARR